MGDNCFAIAVGKFVNFFRGDGVGGDGEASSVFHLCTVFADGGLFQVSVRPVWNTVMIEGTSDVCREMFVVL